MRFVYAMNDNVFHQTIINTGDGLIQHRELQHVMRACMEENGMQFSEDQVSGHIYLEKNFEIQPIPPNEC